MARNDRQHDPRFAHPATFFRAPLRPDNWDGLDIALVGVPFDGGSTNRRGAQSGPRGVREASTDFGPWNSSLDLDPFKVCRIADVGDAVVREPFGGIEYSLDQIQSFFDRLYRVGAMPVTTGGDHSVSLAILRAIAKKAPIGMIHIDAHCDTGMGYMGSRYHHGSPFSRAVEENLLDPKRVIQIGIRGPLNDGTIWSFSRKSGMRVITMDEITRRSIDDVIIEARRHVGDLPCYLSFDIDALDPTTAPGTGTRVPGGLMAREAQQLVRGMRGLRLVGADLVEVAHILDPSGLTSLVAAHMLHDMLCVVAEAAGKAY